MKQTRLFWPVLLTLLAGLCVACILFIRLTARPGAVAQVYYDGNLLHSFPLDEPVEYTFSNPDGGSNTVLIEGGRVCVSHATCPDQVCVNRGWVDTDAIPIVCLPHQLVIQIKGGEQSLDAATG